MHTVHVGGKEIKARAVILAMGAEPKKLGVPGEDELAARGVSYCATCDAAFFRGKQTIVVGGGDTAMEDATFLSKFAGQGRASCTGGRSSAPRRSCSTARARPTTSSWSRRTWCKSFEPGDDGALEQAVLENTEDGSTKRAPGHGRLRRHRPPAELAPRRGSARARRRGLRARRRPLHQTKLPGVFAAGDLTDRVYRQAVTAAGTGCMAALDAEAYLRDTPIDPEAHWAPEPEKVEAAAESAAS